MTIPLQKGLIYGPVNSRRLGRSLGINVVSTKIKTCTFNCVYCQYGLRRLDDEELENSKWYPSPKKIIAKLNQILPIISPPPDYLTFSGNGEATLHPAFPEIVQEVLNVRDTNKVPASVAILSNSSTVNKPRVRKTLALLDRRIMKLDCGNEETFKQFNQPVAGICFSEIINGLREIENITIQSLFAGGSGGNFHQENISAWIDRLKEISPADVQIYTLDRPYPSKLITPLEKDKLLTLKEEALHNGIRAEVY
jgi:wyosine [tRNA(Phe)-imidazoG37] synthetase (radical SAM superfamily)